MSKKTFVVILILSVVVTGIVSFVEFTSNQSLGQFGLPFKFSSISLFADSNTKYMMLLLDIAFWFMVIWVIWKILQKVTSGRAGR